MPAEVSAPIINKPYEKPTRHWLIKRHESPVLIDGRRPPTYHYAPPGASAEEAAELGVEVEIELVSEIRKRLDDWRPLALRGEGGVTRETMELLQYWRRPERNIPLFYAQLEAAETIIFLTEARQDFLQGISIPDDLPGPDKLREGYRPFMRHACKMATGSGKTLVMAMLASWSILNKLANSYDKRYSKAILVVCPNVTIRERLAELNPQLGNASIYRTRDIVSSSMMTRLVQGKLHTINWHLFEPIARKSRRVIRTGKQIIVRETVIISEKSTFARGKRYMRLEELQRGIALGDFRVISENKAPSGEILSMLVEYVKYVESDRALVSRVIAKELGDTGNILVFNDEAHHAYRLREEESATEDEENFADDEEAQRYYKEATVWIDGLDKINKVRGINFCIDFSATPYFLARAGTETNRIFPWTVSSFGLQDAIESGLVKIPQLAVRDTSGQEIPGYFNIWKWVISNLTASERGGARSQIKPAAVLKYAHTPIAMQGQLWDELRNAWRENSDLELPPVYIIVCKDTRLAKVIFDWIANDTPPDPTIPRAQMSALRNSDGAENTIRVDSKVQDEIDSGNAKSDESRWMRYVLSTVGKAEWPKDDTGQSRPPAELELLAKKLKRDASHPPGRDVRCIVSVGMLTEGWDCTTVTHIIGLRPFMSQLLCEQVIGRGLRRVSYDVGADGYMEEEIATVLGVPLTAYPIKISPKGKASGDKAKRYRIYALPERSNFEIRFPRVEGYRQVIRNRIKCELDDVPILQIDPARIPPEVEMKAGMPDPDGKLSLHGPGKVTEASIRQFLERCRLQECIFEVAGTLTKSYFAHEACSIPEKELFTQLYLIVENFVRHKVVAEPPYDKRQVFMAPYYSYMLETLLQGIRPDETSGEDPEKPVYETGRESGSTADVDFLTRRKPYSVKKSHVNAVVPDTRYLEQEAARRLDRDRQVECFVKNEGMGFAIPYFHNGQMHDYMPDFIIRKTDGTHHILETKAYPDPLKDIKAKAARRWVAAVNADGKFGTWSYRMVAEASEI